MGGGTGGGALKRGVPTLLAALLAAGTGCDDGPTRPSARTGGLATGRVVAIGDGYPAGVTDGALFRAGQEASLPALFVRRALDRDGPAQPLVADPGFSALDPEAGGRLALAGLRPLALTRLPRGGPPLAFELDRPYDNLGVPGALLTEALGARSAATSLFGNPFYDIVLRGRGTFVEQAAELDASLVLLWIGTTDALGYVAAGGDVGLAPGLPTPIGTFALSFERLLDQALEVSDQVALFTVPDVTRFPLVQALPTVALDTATGDTLRDRFGAPVPLLGPDGPLGAGDRVVLTALPSLAAGLGVPVGLGGTGEPLPDRLVLGAVEQEIARTAVAGYNDAIRSLAAERRLPLVDVAAFVDALAGGGVVTDGILMTADFPAGQAFGLDGAHFTPKAYGALVNRLVAALNGRYGSALAPIRTDDLPGVSLLRLDPAGSIFLPDPSPASNPGRMDP